MAAFGRAGSVSVSGNLNVTLGEPDSNATLVSPRVERKNFTTLRGAKPTRNERH